MDCVLISCLCSYLKFIWLWWSQLCGGFCSLLTINKLWAKEFLYFNHSFNRKLIIDLRP